MKKAVFIGSVFLVAALLIAPGVLSAGENFRAHLSNDEAGAISQGQGEAIFKLSKDGDQLYYKLIVANIENITMAHIHLAPPGQNGPIVVWLYPEQPPAVLIPGRFDGVLAEGYITAEDLVGPLTGNTLGELIDAIEAGNTYVNVHTNQYPGGEIRGQIQ